MVEVTGLAHQRLLTQSNRVQCDLGHRHGIAVGGIATFEPVPDNKKSALTGGKILVEVTGLEPVTPCL